MDWQDLLDPGRVQYAQRRRNGGWLAHNPAQSKRSRSAYHPRVIRCCPGMIPLFRCPSGAGRYLRNPSRGDPKAPKDRPIFRSAQQDNISSTVRTEINGTTGSRRYASPVPLGQSQDRFESLFCRGKVPACPQSSMALDLNGKDARVRCAAFPNEIERQFCFLIPALRPCTPTLPCQVHQTLGIHWPYGQRPVNVNV